MREKRNLLLLIVMCFSCSFQVKAQFIESFSNWNESGSPQWGGDIGKYKVIALGPDNFLNSEDTQAGSSFIYTPSKVLLGGTWTLRFALYGKSVSSKVFSRFYLAASASDLTSSLKGYYLDLGSHDSELLLVRQEGVMGKDTTVLISSSNVASLSNYSDWNIKVTCSDVGEWKMWIDLSDGYTFCDSTTESRPLTTSSYAGIYCKYAKGSVGNFLYGDLSVSGPSTNPTPEPTPDPDPTPDPNPVPDPIPHPETPSDSDTLSINDSLAIVKNPFHLASRAFSPDGDGVNDEARLGYQLSASGYAIKLTVFDASGHKRRSIDISTLSTSSSPEESTLIWDGKDDDGDLCPVGIYVLLVEATHPSAPRVTKKIVVVLNR